MKRYFRTIQSVLDSRWGNFRYAGMPAAQKTDRVLQSSKLEDCIYRDLSKDDENLEAIQQEAASKLHSFPALSRDIFQSFYSLFPKRTDTGRLTAEAQKFNAKLLDHVTIRRSSRSAKAGNCPPTRPHPSLRQRSARSWMSCCRSLAARTVR